MFFNIYLIVEVLLTRVEDNSFECILLLLIIITLRRYRRANGFNKYNNVVISLLM